MQTTIPLYGFGGSGGVGATLTVTAPAGATVTVSKDGKEKTKTAGADGVAVFKGLSTGEWTVTITDGEQISAKTVTITTDYALLISFSVIPEFTYTGDFEIVNDADEPITASQDNWKIRFLTSGTLTFTSLNGAEAGIDVFVCGGGGGGGRRAGSQGGSGGGGGYTLTQLGMTAVTGVAYPITIGSGGAGQSTTGAGGAGGSSSFDTLSANGGNGADQYKGGNGGSGGGGDYYGNGGTNGANGTGSSAGTGSGKNMHEFEDEAAKIYGGGGGSYTNQLPEEKGLAGDESAGGGAPVKTGNGLDGAENRGGGGGGSYSGNGGNGGSGIVIIRNAREVAQMAKSMALVSGGTVVNLLWCPDNAQPTDSLLDIGDRPVGIGDTYADGKFYRVGVEVLTPLEAALAELADAQAALALLGVTADE